MMPTSIGTRRSAGDAVGGQAGDLERDRTGGDGDHHQEADAGRRVAGEAEEAAAVMVMPERDVPGLRARAWATPTNSASRCRRFRVAAAGRPVGEQEEATEDEARR